MNEPEQVPSPEEQPTTPQKKRSKGQELKTIKSLMAILNHPTLKDAYKSLHPRSSEESARKNAGNMLTPEVMDELRRVLSVDPKIRTTRATLERFLYFILGQYTKGDVKAGDALRAVELLSKLVPEFKDRIGVEDLSQLSESEIDSRLRRLGVDLPQNPNEASN